MPGSADPRAHVAKVPRLEDPGSGALDRPPGHDASASIARATPDEHPPSPPRSVAPSVPSYTLSPTTTSAQMAARVIAAAAERASGVAVDERGPARAAPAVEARSEPRPITVAFSETEIARSPLSAVAATTVVAKGPPECVGKPSPPPEARAEAAPVDATVSPGPEPPRPNDAPAPTEANEASVGPTKPEPATDADAADDTRRDVASNITRAPDDEPPAVGLVTNVSHRGDVKTDHLNDATVSVAANLGLPKDPHLRWRAIQNDPDPFVKNVLARLRAAESVEPYHQVGADWRRAPWDTNPYETIGPGYARAGDMPAADAATAEAKLKTSLPDGWMDLPPDAPRPTAVVPPPDETPCLVCGRADDEAAFVLCESCPSGGHFRCLNLPSVPEGEWFCGACGGAPTPTPAPRKDLSEKKSVSSNARKTNGVSSTHTNDFVPSSAHTATSHGSYAAATPNAKPLWENRVPLRLGLDVEERPMWGMDCYTRVAIDAAVAQAPSFAGTDPDAVARRETFFAKKLMPAVHALWKDGWDLKLAVRKVEEAAREEKARIKNGAPFGKKTETATETAKETDARVQELILSPDATLEACRCLVRAIEEIDEAGLDTHPPPRPPKGQRSSASRSSKKGGAHSASYVPPGVQIKRPLGAYMIYANEVRPGLVASKPPEWARNISEIGKALGAGWKALSAEERARYAEKAAALKKQFEEVDLPAAIKKAEEEEEARVEAEAAEEKRAREAAAAAAAAVVAAREERLKKRADEAAATAAAREERRRNRASEPTLADSRDVLDGHTTDQKSYDGSFAPEAFADGGERDENVTATRDMPGFMVSGENHPTSLVTETEEFVLEEQRYLPPNRRAAKRRHFRLHPKGVGVVCVREGGIPAGTYVQDYLGELYTPWRWYERQDAIKKREPGKALPDFFNITLERPKEDAAGVDTIFVEAAHRCTFASRLSHSCAPNVQTVVLAVGGELTIAQYTTRDIEYGEELCWNYSCVTESEKEYRAAICLCSSTRCKGAFLDYAGSSSFTAVMGTRHNFCDRNAVLIRACSEKVTQDDRAALARAGVKSAALCMAGDVVSDDGGDAAAAADAMTNATNATNAGAMPNAKPANECPEWLVKWAALTLEYIETEKALLPDALMEKPLDGITYDRAFAEATAQGVAATRLTNLVVTLDKIKYVMRQPGQCRAPFLRPLSDAETVEHLWLGPHGIFKRAVDAMAASGAGPNALGGKGSKARDVVARLKAETRDSSAIATPAEARAGLRRVAERVRACGGEHVALADCLLLYAATERWVTPAPYVGFTSAPVSLTPLPKDAEYREPRTKTNGASFGASFAEASAAIDGDASTRLDADGDIVDDPNRVAADAKASAKLAPEAPPKLAKRYRGDVENVMRKKYQQHFAWGQLVSWFKQTIYDPSASLSADRRGTMSLPDPESAYGGSKPGTYERSERKALLAHLEKNPDRSWPTTWRWSFRNPAKVYGSPFIDDAIRVSRGEERTSPAFVRAMREM